MIAGLALLCVCIIGIALVVLAQVPFEFQQARQRWQQHGPRHYQLDVVWTRGWSSGNVRVEMRDNHLVAATDLDTGKPIDTSMRPDVPYFGSIDNLFTIIEARMRPVWNWRNLLARAAPSLASRVASCEVPLSDVHYDTQFGYPSTLAFSDGWCDSAAFPTSSHVTITQFTPLP